MKKTLTVTFPAPLPAEIECPICNNTAKRIISLSSFELKGGGWYKDGYGTKKPESKPSPPKTSDGVTKAKPIKDE